MERYPFASFASGLRDERAKDTFAKFANAHFCWVVADHIYRQEERRERGQPVIPAPARWRAG